MSHEHNHDHGSHHHEHTPRVRCNAEYRYYRYLFIVGFVCAIGEFEIARTLGNSISAQADAIHAFTHLLLQGLGLWVSRQVLMRQMNNHEEGHYREQFTYWYAGIIFVGLGWLVYNSFAKIFSAEAVLRTHPLSLMSSSTAKK